MGGDPVEAGLVRSLIRTAGLRMPKFKFRPWVPSLRRNSQPPAF